MDLVIDFKDVPDLYRLTICLISSTDGFCLLGGCLPLLPAPLFRLYLIKYLLS